jgi:hypothetical protein
VTRALWLPDVLGAAGLRVQVVPGWQGRTTADDRGRPQELADLRGVLLHHTGGPREGNYPSLATVRDGRPNLAGPLAQLGVARDGTWVVVAAGRANHAGTGVLPWVPRDSGNEHLLGVEAESTGGGDWTVEQIHAYPVGVAAILRYLGLDASRAAGHKEYAPSRKIDPAGWPGGLDGFRAHVAAELAGGDDMPITQADADLIVDTLLRRPLRDLYPDVPDRDITVGETLQWAAANAGRAQFRAEQVLDRLSKPSPGPAALGDLNAALRSALAELGPLTLTPVKKE